MNLTEEHQELPGKERKLGNDETFTAGFCHLPVLPVETAPQTVDSRHSTPGGW